MSVIFMASIGANRLPSNNSLPPVAPADFFPPVAQITNLRYVVREG
jgi:hypothetical protein